MTLSKNNSQGFTLIELLVVIMIIGILATIATVMLSATRPKARDMERIANVKQIQTALELYYADEGSYPNTDEVEPGEALINPETGIVYLSEVPTNPLPVDGECDSTEDAEINYMPTDNNNNYQLSYCLGNNVDWVPSGQNTANNVSISEPFICGLPIQHGGQTYNTTSINGECVIKENINIGTMISLTAMPSDDNIIEKWCIYNNTAYCDQDGAYYTWSEALGLPAECNNSSEGVCNISGEQQGICPPGFHIATDNDMYALESLYGPDSCSTSRSGWGCFQAYDALGGRPSSSNFDWVFTGYKPHGVNSIINAPFVGVIMTSDAYLPYANYYRMIENISLTDPAREFRGVYRMGGNKDMGANIRCFKN